MEKIILRAITLADLNKTIVWSNQKDISDLYLGHPFPVNPETEKIWYDKILTSNFPTTVFGIELIEGRLLIGLSLLKNINLINRTSEFAIFIGDKDYRQKGLAKEATLETLSFGFNKLGLNRIYLKVLEENEAAVKLYLKTGFKQEGILRKNVFKNNQFKSELLMAILKNEFRG
jgi:RimJ/RimL family protein N-acetyltransferase